MAITDISFRKISASLKTRWDYVAHYKLLCFTRNKTSVFSFVINSSGWLWTNIVIESAFRTTRIWKLIHVVIIVTGFFLISRAPSDLAWIWKQFRAENVLFPVYKLSFRVIGLPYIIPACNKISLFVNWYGTIGLFVRHAVFVLIRHSGCEYVLQTYFSFVVIWSRYSVFDSFLVT